MVGWKVVQLSLEAVRVSNGSGIESCEKRMRYERKNASDLHFKLLISNLLDNAKQE